MGRLFAFRWRDWCDCKSCAPGSGLTATDQQIGVGDGTTKKFQLTRGYTSGPATYTRPIQKPVPGTVLLAVDGAAQTEGGDFTVNADTGVVTFNSAPSAGADITAGYEFDVPVRFDTDLIEVSLSSFEAGEIPAIPVIEVRV
jgi:uncharacterized protein (TIGR02217 family)